MTELKLLKELESACRRDPNIATLVVEQLADLDALRRLKSSNKKRAAEFKERQLDAFQTGERSQA